jgi:regulator of protease activity HflC (stomatin/prohibitin superfamily)
MYVYELIPKLIIPFGVLAVLLSLRLAREDERLFVFRSGRLVRIEEPGLCMIIPFVEKYVRVNLKEINEKIPGWHALPKEVLGEKIKALGLYKL